MNELRDLRRAMELGQRDFAALLSVPLETFRPWDSGRRDVPAPILQRAREAVAQRDRENELIPLRRLASELGVHIRTVRAAARTGLLAIRTLRSDRGRLVRCATRRAGYEFKRLHYRQFAGHVCALPLLAVPAYYDVRLKRLHRRLRLTQGALAQTIGAAGKAVVYQWESRKRVPSPGFWRTIENLERTPRSR